MKANLHPSTGSSWRGAPAGISSRPARPPRRSTSKSAPVPPVLHRQAAPGGYRRPGGPVPPQVPERAGDACQGVTHGGPTPPGARRGRRRSPGRWPIRRSPGTRRTASRSGASTPGSLPSCGSPSGSPGSRTSWNRPGELATDADPELAALARADLARLPAEIETARAPSCTICSFPGIRTTTATPSSRSAPAPAATKPRSSPPISYACTPDSPSGTGLTSSRSA